MSWTETARREHDRSRLRSASDYTDDEWAVVQPLLRRTSRVGRPRNHKTRTLWNAIQYIAATGCQPAINNFGHSLLRQSIPHCHETSLFVSISD